VALASDPHTHPNILALMVDDPQLVVRDALVSNPSAPPAALMRLVLDADPSMRQRAASNQALSLRLRILAGLSQE